MTLTICADFSRAEQDREKEEHVQTIKGPPLVGALFRTVVGANPNPDLQIQYSILLLIP